MDVVAVTQVFVALLSDVGGEQALVGAGDGNGLLVGADTQA